MASGKDEDLMTRREVAEMFHTTPQVVAYWALRKKPPLLTEIRTASNKPRYRRSEVQALWASGYRW
jgi:hypothetical protein